MIKHQLYATMAKFASDVPKVEYLGHIISAEGVASDPKKILAVKQWPLPINLV